VVGDGALDDDGRTHRSLGASLTLRSCSTLRTLRARTNRTLHTLRPGRALRSSNPLAALRTLGSRLASLALRTLDALRAVTRLIAGQLGFNPFLGDKMFVLLGLDEQGDVCM